MAPALRRSIRRRIPSLIALILLLAVVAFGVVTYRVVEDSAVAAADARLGDASRQLASLFTESFGTMLDSARAVAADPALARALDDPAAVEAAVAALRRLGPLQGTLRRVDLRDAEGRVVGSVPGGSAPVGAALAEEHLPNGVSPFFLFGDTVYYAVRVPVTGGAAGSVTVVRSLTTSPEAVERIADLIAVDADLLLGNLDGSLWTDLVSTVERPPSTGALVYRRAGTLMRSVALPVGEHPVQVAVELPQERVLAAPRDLLATLAFLGAAVVGLGALAGWLLSRPITAPLVALAGSADAIAAGDLNVRPVATDRFDEIGRLARSFQVMAASVRQGHDTLERQVEERTAELAHTLEQLREAQEELVRQERLATLGQLSGSVGHELRNPLGVMTNAVYYLRHVMSDASPKQEKYLDILASQIHLCEKIVADLLDFARVKPPETERVSVSELVAEQIDRVTVPASVSIEEVREEGLPELEVDRVQVGQVLLNILTNAVQATAEQGGVVTIRAVLGDGHVRLRVEDSGPGVPPEDRENVFEPLFTTKPRGIGLGLSVSRTLARGNGGDLHLAEDPGPGATFVLTLPAAEGAS